MQAIAEVGCTVVVPHEEEERWRYAATWFDLPYRIGTGTTAITIDIDHSTPRVQLGDISRPLLFPQRAVDLYRRAWAGHRTIWAYFAGRVSADRGRTLRRWATGHDVPLRKRRRPGAGYAYVRRTSSGRSWPTKAWDPEYVRDLGESQFVLCPDGDFVWTYRFFEATLAGAIPVIQSRCELFQGFAVASMRDPVDSLRWSEAVAVANFERAQRMLTVPEEQLRRAIRGLLSDG